MLKQTLPEEYTLNLYINGGWGVKLICTSTDLRELVTGFLYNEGIIASAGDITSLKIDREAGRADVAARGGVELPGCFIRASGLGGDELTETAEIVKVPSGRTYTLDDIRRSWEKLDAAAISYAQTGGVHCSALFDGGAMLSIYEDIGRHNTLDKIAGDLLIRGVPLRDGLLITTGRISSDMVRKAARLGAAVIASYSKPTRRAYDMACAADMALLGYIKKEPQLFCGGERVTL